MAAAIHGRTDRIALIHAVYALAWIGLALAGNSLSIVAAVALSVPLVVLIAVAWRRLDRRGAPLAPAAAAIGRQIRLINIVTALIAVATIGVAHGAHADRLIAPAVLAVMAVHFVPLWMILRRVSMLWMAAALGGVAVIGWLTQGTPTASLLASAVFAANSLRLLAGTRA